MVISRLKSSFYVLCSATQEDVLARENLKRGIFFHMSFSSRSGPNRATNNLRGHTILPLELLTFSPLSPTCKHMCLPVRQRSQRKAGQRGSVYAHESERPQAICQIKAASDEQRPGGRPIHGAAGSPALLPLPPVVVARIASARSYHRASSDLRFACHWLRLSACRCLETCRNYCCVTKPQKDSMLLIRNGHA